MTVVLRGFMALALVAAIAGCSDDAARYLLDKPAPSQTVRVPVASIELRQVTLPAYASASEIIVQDKDGALRRVPDATWADDPSRAITLSLARNLDEVTTATAAAEPWPLEVPADVRIEVRIERMVAQTNGIYQMSGQFSIAAPEAAVRESINRFEIQQTIPDTSPKAVAQATSAALLTLSEQIAARLRR